MLLVLSKLSGCCRLAHLLDLILESSLVPRFNLSPLCGRFYYHCHCCCPCHLLDRLLQKRIGGYRVKISSFLDIDRSVTKQDLPSPVVSRHDHCFGCTSSQDLKDEEEQQVEALIVAPSSAQATTQVE